MKMSDHFDRAQAKQIVLKSLGEDNVYKVKHEELISAIALALKQERANAELDAKRWRAFVRSTKIRFLGWAGFSSHKNHNSADPYRHFGAEFWTVVAKGEEDSKEKVQENIDFLNEFADQAIRVQE